MILKPNEIVDELGVKDYKIIQSEDGFKFGIDAVLLANFVSPKKSDIGVDLGSGTGIISTIIVGKSEVKSIVGVEIQKDVCDMSIRSSKLNSLEDRLSFLNIDIKDVDKFLEKHSYDFVTSNPPYYKANTLSSPNDKKLISRHEVLVTLEDIFKTATFLLKPQKHFYIIHKPERLVELFQLAVKYKLEPKEIQFVYPSMDKSPNLVLIRYTKNGKPELKFRKPLYVYNSDGEYSDDINYIYSNKILSKKI